MAKKRILILVNENKDINFEFSKIVISFLKKNDCNVFVEKEVFEHVENTEVFIEGQSVIDFALILGGDGTLLNYAHKYKSNFPFFGINLGRVGALTEASTEDYEFKLLEIINGNCFIEERNTIDCKIMKNNELYFEDIAFNEVSLQRGKLYKMLYINMFVNNNNKTSFFADGVVISTSTGSSAFSLSCGGPLLLPTARNFVITPISPQLRTITSLVINDTDLITINLEEHVIREEFTQEKPIVVVDGYKMIEIDRDSEIVLSKSEKKLKIVRVDGQASLFEPTFRVSMSNQNIKKMGGNYE